jgi:multimeric flavodoxin WrbA
MSKKVLGICFSEVRNGNSAILLNELLRPAKESGLEVEQVNIGEFEIKQCVGCFRCNNATFSCVLKDDLEKVLAKLDEADAIVISSPCYITAAPAQIKALMDRCAARALDQIENESKHRLGVAVSVAGATNTWYSLQRVFPSLFLKLFHCDLVAQKVYGGIALKGDVLNHPEVLQDAMRIGEELVSALNDTNIQRKTPLYEDGSLICPSCRADVFLVHTRAKITCAVCGATLQKEGLFQTRYSVVNGGKFTKEGAQEHTAYVGGRIMQGMAFAEETTRRLRLYEADGTILESKPELPPSDPSATVVWDTEAEDVFRKVVPRAFQRFVHAAVEKKAAALGHSIITKEVFLAIKKASGN